MSHAPDTVLLDAALGSCETRLRATIEHLAALQSTLDDEIDRLSGLESALGRLPSATLAPDPPAAALHGPALPGASIGTGSASSVRTRRSRSRLPSRRAWAGLAIGVVAVSVVVVTAVSRGAPARGSGLLIVANEPTLVRLDGSVWLWRPGADWMIVESATSLRPGDRIRTEANGRATVTWPNGATAALEPAAALTLEPPGSDGTVRVELDEGGAWLDGGHEPTSPRVEAVTSDGARVAGTRYQLRRETTGRVVVDSADRPVEVQAQGTRREVPPGNSSEVLPGQQPALARPVTLAPALAITVDGPPAWLVVDRFGRVVGAPPGGGPWLNQVPAARGPLPRPDGAGVLVPEPKGDYQLVMWASESGRDYRIVAWTTDGQAVYGGAPPPEDAGALRLEGSIPAGGAVVLRMTARERGVALASPAHAADELPPGLQLAVPPAAAALKLTSAALERPPDRRPAPPPPVQRLAPAPSPLPTVSEAAAVSPPAVEASVASAPTTEPSIAAELGSAPPPQAEPTPVVEAAPPEAGEPEAVAAEDADADQPAEEPDAEEVAASPEPDVAPTSGASVRLGGPLPDLTATAVAPRTATPTPQRSPTPDPETLQRVSAPSIVSTVTIGDGPAQPPGAGVLPGQQANLSADRLPLVTPSPSATRLAITPVVATPEMILLPSPTLLPIVVTVVLPRTTPGPTSITLRGFATMGITASPVVVGTPVPAGLPTARPR